MADRFSTDLRRRNYNNRGLIRHRFTDRPCRMDPDGRLWAYIVTTFQSGLLLTSSDGGFTWSAIPRSDTGSQDLWYHLGPRGVASTDVQGPIVFVEIQNDSGGIFALTGGDTVAGQYTDYAQFISTVAMTADPPSDKITLIAADVALEGVFSAGSYQNRIIFAYVADADNYLYIDNLSPYDGALRGTVQENSFEYSNRHSIAVNGETGFADIVIQSDEGGGAGITYPVLSGWDGDRYANVTTCMISKGGISYHDGFLATETKHCIYVEGLIVVGTHKPKLIYDSTTGFYLLQCTSLEYGGDEYIDVFPAGGSDQRYTQLYAGIDVLNTIYTYDVAAPSGDDYGKMVREPLAITGFAPAPIPDGGVDGVADIDALLIYDSVENRRYTILVAETLRAELASYAAGRPSWTVILTVYSVYTANGAGSDYTFDESAITGAGAALWGSPSIIDGCGGMRAINDYEHEIGTPSASKNPEPQALISGGHSATNLGIKGHISVIAATEDVDAILASKSGRDHTFLCRHTAKALLVDLLTTGGYTIADDIESVFTSNGSHADYTFNLAAITGAGATLTGGDGAFGERTPGSSPADVGLRHVRYNFLDHTTGTVHLIAPVTVQSVAVARDGYGTLCAVYAEEVGSTLVIKVAFSYNDGSAWVVSTPSVGSTTTFTDTVSAEVDARCDIIGGKDGGFLFMYTREDGVIPRLYVRHITTSNGSSYTIGDQKEATSRSATDNIVGGRFFHPSEDTLVDLTIPGFVRIAYQIEEGNSERMLDSIPVRFAQELLTTAYPVSTPTTNTATNQDFYAAGMVGAYTIKYLESFVNIGTTYHTRLYEPNVNAEMGDRNAYGVATEYNQTCILDPGSYGFPIQELPAADQSAWIEQDIRKVYFPPNFPLLRNFVLNAGGFLKRTVWTILFDGNEYEISQVVPRFLDDQIVFYEANAYVIGPSRDPWARTVLPSET